MSVKNERRQFPPPIGRLHLITDIVVQSRYSHAELAELAIDGGVDTIQYRSKESDFRRLLGEAVETREVCRRHGVLFLVNDRVDLALAVEADGVHLGQRDMPIATARRILGAEAIIGGTIRNRADLEAAVSEGADYVGLGPLFPTSTKNVDHEPIGVEAAAGIAAGSPIPIIGIAGITRDNLASVLAAGLYGVAVIGAIAAAENVRTAARQFSDVIGATRGDEEKNKRADARE